LLEEEHFPSVFFSPTGHVLLVGVYQKSKLWACNYKGL